jgi:hypothetical protein
VTFGCCAADSKLAKHDSELRKRVGEERQSSLNLKQVVENAEEENAELRHRCGLLPPCSLLALLDSVWAGTVQGGGVVLRARSTLQDGPGDRS